MKKFTRILAVLMAAVMAMTAMCVTSSAANKSAFDKIEAEDFDGKYEEVYKGYFGVFHTYDGSPEYIHWIFDGTSTYYKNVDFGNGADTFSVCAAPDHKVGASIEIRLDSISGECIGTCKVSYTGASNKFKTFSCKVSGVSGIHDVYLVYKGDNRYEPLLNVDYFKFTGSSSSSSSSTSTKETMPIIYIEVGTKAKMGALISGKKATSVTYSSSNKKVATVNSKGKITGVKAGTAVITAKSGSTTVKIQVVVEADD